MEEKTKVTIEELQKRLGDLREYAESSRTELESMIRRKPIESAGMIFVAGVFVGILLGSALARRG
jgi:ElaB/YqjD/DUF883 family membrane-anchored ribosome-binding protein